MIEDPRIEKINLTSGPMAVMGSTRMQATTIELCAMITVLEMALRGILAEINPVRKAGFALGALRGNTGPA